MLMPSHCYNIELTTSSYSSTVSNASSPLLRLPQELKDRIYQFVYGGFYVRVAEDYSCVGLDLAPRMAAFREICYHEVGRWTYKGFEHLPVASLGTCRQLYHEAKNVLYSANRLSLSDPKLVNTFIRRLDNLNHRSLAMRSVYLVVYVHNKNREREWDNTFRVLAESFKNLRHIRIMVEQRIWNGYQDYSHRRRSPAQGNMPFLQGLLELKKLPLKTVDLVVTKDMRYGSLRGDAYNWTDAQKREWERHMEGAILGSL